MERYSIFTEKSSGVNPFLLSPYECWLPFGFFLIILRVPLIIFFSVLLFPLEYFACLLETCVPSLGSVLRKYFVSTIARALLFSLGFHAGCLSQIQLRKEAVTIRPPPRLTAPSPKGEVFLVNQTSWLDSLVVLSCRGCAWGALDDGGGLRRVSHTSAVLNYFCGRASSTRAPSTTTRLTGCPSIAIQPEGAPTNGKAILTCVPGLGRLGGSLASLPPSTPRPTFFVLALHYALGVGKFSPCFLAASSPWYHLLCLLSQPYSKVTLYSLPSSFDPQPSDDLVGGNWATAVGSSWEQLLRGHGVKVVEWDLSTHRKFVEMAGEGSKKVA